MTMRFTVALRCLVLGVLIVAWAVDLAWPEDAQALPQQFNYQGRLTEVGGAAVDGVVSMTFRLYDSETGVTAVWEETQSVDVMTGVFNVFLGEVNPLTVDFSVQHWLEIEVDGDLMNERLALVPVPYAHHALSSVTAESAETAVTAESAETAETAGYASDAGTLDGMAPSELEESAEITSAVSAHAADADAHHVDTLDNLACLDGEIVTWNDSYALWECDEDQDTDTQLSEYQVEQYVTDDALDLAAGTTVDGDAIATEPVVADVEGLDIEPASVTIYGTSTVLEDGELDLGSGAADEITAAMVETLTGGGNADSLHEHTGQQAGTTSIEYVGVTATQRGCGDGLAQLNADCAAAYPGSKLCTDQWILNTFPAPVPGVGAYVLYVPLSSGATTTNNVFGMFLSDNMYPNCPSGSNYATAGPFTNDSPSYSQRYYSLTLEPDGNFALRECGPSASYVATCCSP